MPEGGLALVANARMYAVTPAAREAWRDLFAWVGRQADIPLSFVEHAAPAPLEDLWTRPDLALGFACGYPFAQRSFALEPVAAPIPSPARYGGQPVYCTDFVVRADSPIRRLEDAFGGRIGWTVAHSQSGFNAVRHHLLQYRSDGVTRLFRESIGPLLTPRGVVEAVLSRAIDIGPLDSYAHDLLKLHAPETARGLRTVESTAMTAMPLLVASAGTDAGARERLREALLAARPDDPELAFPLAQLLLRGFAAVDREAYEELSTQAIRAEQAGYLAPA